MKGLETGKSKIQKICDTLRKETLEPAKQEAREIIENAHLQAKSILAEAQRQAQDRQDALEKEMQEKQRVFQASLSLSARQGVESLKQKIEQQLFRKELGEWVQQEMSDPKLIADLLHSFMRMMEEKGMEEDLIVTIPKEISPKAVCQFLVPRVLEKLQTSFVVSSELGGGVQIQLKEKQLTLDVSDTFVHELLSLYIRRDLRDLIFNA